VPPSLILPDLFPQRDADKFRPRTPDNLVTLEVGMMLALENGRTIRAFKHC
jgi:hypothetical protein